MDTLTRIRTFIDIVEAGGFSQVIVKAYIGVDDKKNAREILWSIERLMFCHEICGRHRAGHH